MTYGNISKTCAIIKNFTPTRLSCAAREKLPQCSMAGALLSRPRSRPGHLAARRTHFANPVYLGYARRISRAYAAFVTARGSRRLGSLGARRRNSHPAGSLAVSEGALYGGAFGVQIRPDTLPPNNSRYKRPTKKMVVFISPLSRKKMAPC